MSVLLLHDANVASDQARIGVCWGVGNVLAAFTTPKSARPDGRGNSQLAGQPQVLQVTWERCLHQPVFRKLINESAQVFLNLQKASNEPDGLANAQLLRISRQYRSIIRDCQEQLDLDQSEDAAQQSELMYKLELVWNLIEVLFVEKNASGIILPQLLQWIRFHFPRCDEKAKDVLAGVVSSSHRDQDPEFIDRPERHPDYWDAITLYVMQGKLDNARRLLELHSDSRSDAFVSMDELLRKMPVYHLGVSSFDFDCRWRHWQNEVRARTDEGDFAVEEALDELAKLLAGSSLVFFTKVVDLCETWYEWMVVKLLFTNPLVKMYDLSLCAQEAVSKFGGLESMTALDSVILSALELDITQMMNELCNTLDSFWFPAHILDLLHHADQLQDSYAQSAAENQFLNDLQADESLREFLLLEYASSLIGHCSLWQVGILYLDQCPVQGPYRMELMLERIALTSEKKAEKVLSMAIERGLTSIATSVYKVMGMRYARAGLIGQAMSWALRSKDVPLTTMLADQLLQKYCDEGTFSQADLLDHLGSCMTVSERLTFLAKYREFHQLVQSGELKTAATLLHSLLWSRLAPRYFWVTLLTDMLPFLKTSDAGVEMCDGDDDDDTEDDAAGDEQPLYLDSEQTAELLHCLQELVQERDQLPKKQQLLLSQQEKDIRTGLARNMAYALMNENDQVQ